MINIILLLKEMLKSYMNKCIYICKLLHIKKTLKWELKRLFCEKKDYEKKRKLVQIVKS